MIAKKIVEQAVLLGERKALVAIVTPPRMGSTAAGVAAADRAMTPSATGPVAASMSVDEAARSASMAAIGPTARDLPIVLILNSGILHRVGSSRMSVMLARALAEIGYCSVRFDLSGIGDSAPREDGLPPFEASMADIREAIDSVARLRGVKRIVLMGLCSGADQSLFYAGTDPRVAGIVMLDPSVPRTARYYFNHYSRRIFRSASWLNVLRGTHPMWRTQSRRRNAGAPKERSELPSKPEPDNEDFSVDARQVRDAFDRAYADALTNGRKILAVLTDGLTARCNYRTQLLSAFPRLRGQPQLQLEYFTGCDHAFTSLSNRTKLMELITRWFDQMYSR